MQPITRHAPGWHHRLAGEGGRRTEITELKVYKDRRQEFGPEEFERVFARRDDAVEPNTDGQTNGGGGLNLVTGLNVDSVIGRIKAGNQWHINVVRLVGHWVNRGWSDNEIQLTTQAIILPGYTHGDTEREVCKAIEGARKKWDTPNPEHDIEDTLPDLKATPLGNLDPAAIPAREWILGNA